MKTYLYAISLLLLMSSCCDTNTIEDYDHQYDKYFPEKGASILLFFSKSDTAKFDTLSIISDVSETVKIKVNGDGCRQNFIQRKAELNIPRTNESSFSLSTNGFDNSLEYNIKYDNSFSHFGYVLYNNTIEGNVDYDCIYRTMKIGSKNYDNVIQFVMPDSNPFDLTKIFLVENHGIMQLTYKNGDTLIRK